MTEISEDNKISYAGRFEYLTATQRHWPDLWRHCRNCHRNPKRAWPATFSELQSMPEHANVQRQSEHGAEIRNQNEWMVDAAVQTVGNPKLGSMALHTEFAAIRRSPHALESGCLLRPHHGATSATQPRVNSWRSWINTEDRRAIWGVRKRALEVHAAWTALWQRQEPRSDSHLAFSDRTS